MRNYLLLLIICLGLSPKFPVLSEQLPAPLGKSELSSVVGGMEIQGFPVPNPSTTFYEDNLPIDVILRHNDFSETEVILQTFVGGAKADAFFVSTPTLNYPWREGRLRSRVNWPLGVGTSTLELKYCDTTACGLSPVGPTSVAGLKLSPSVNVVNVWFYNTSENNGAATTPFTEDDAKAILDNLEFNYHIAPGATIPPIEPTDSLDTLLEQCSTSNRVQFRYAGMGPTVDITGSNILTLDAEDFSTHTQSLWVDTGFDAAADNNDVNEEDYHVFLVRDALFVYPPESPNDPIRFDGATRGRDPNAPNNGRNNKIIINLFQLDSFRMTNVLTHEIGHSMGDLTHGSAPAAKCGIGITTNEALLANRNVMCGGDDEDVFAGRHLTTGQCNAIYSNVPQLTDRNQ